MQIWSQKKYFADCAEAISALFFLICSDVGLSTVDKIALQHMFEKVSESISNCFMDQANNEG